MIHHTDGTTSMQRNDADAFFDGRRANLAGEMVCHSLAQGDLSGCADKRCLRECVERSD